MKKGILLLVLCALVTGAMAQDFGKHFYEKTLRIDYIFTGNSQKQEICVDGLSSTNGWAGRKEHLAELPLEGNGQITVRDTAQNVLYRTSFSSLFQEWLDTDEAQTLTKGFENTFLVPFPRESVDVEIKLFDKRHEVTTSLTHRVDPNDILIRQRGETVQTPHRYLLKNGSWDKAIDLAILAEGYTEEEMDVFYRDAQAVVDAIFSYEPFKSKKDKFNVVAVASPSDESGVSIPKDGVWKATAFGSHYSTFYSDRYLTTSRLKAVHDALSGIPYEHIIILANTTEYGGGGIYNSYLMAAAHHATFRPVVVHEFGHSFAGLADEYFYDDDVMTDTYPTDVEPWEQNVTTLIDFESKWKDMLDKGVKVPTPREDKDKVRVGVFEGGAYSKDGVYRPSYDCRMRTNECPEFCDVCKRAIERLISFYTE